MKFCTKCGTQLLDDDEICNKCGQNTEDIPAFTPMPQQPPVAVQLNSTDKPPRKKAKALFIVLPIVLVLLLIGAAYYFFVLNVSPAVAFIKANGSFFDKMTSMESGEISKRMGKEDFEASYNTTLKNLSDSLSQEILGDMTYAYKLIKAKNGGGINVAINMGDAGLTELTGLLTDDKLIAGISAGDKSSASFLYLPGNKNTPLIERLVALLAKTEPDGKIDALLKKVTNAAEKSIDMKWFSTKAGSYKDLFNKGNKVNATAVSMTLNAEDLKKFISSFAAILDKDPTFYKDLQEVIKRISEDAPIDAAQKVKEALEGLDDKIPADSFSVVWTAYQNWWKTEAVEISFKLKAEDTASFDIFMQNKEQDKKETIKFDAAIAAGSTTPENVNMTIEKTNKQNGNGYNIDLTTTGEQSMHINYTGDVQETKKNANEYNVKSKLDVTAEMPGLEGENSKIKAAYESEMQVVFGATFENSRFFNMEKMQKEAVKAESVEDFIAKLSSVSDDYTSGLLNDYLKDMPELSIPAEQASTDPNAVATVNGESIYKDEVDEGYTQMVSIYEQMGMPVDETDIEQVLQIKNSIIDSLVMSKVVLQKAKEQGFDILSKEEEDEITKNITEELQSFKDQLKSEVEEEAKTDTSIKVDEEVDKRYTDALSQAGYTEETYIQYAQKTMREQKTQDKLKDSLKDKTALSDAEIQEWYDGELKTQQEAVTSDPSAFYDYYDDGVALFVPEGIVRVQQILIKLPDEQTAAVQELYNSGKNNDAIKKLAPYLKKIKPKANEALAKVKKGEDFSALMDQYNEDTGLKEEPAKSEGYVIIPGNEMYLSEFTNAALKLKSTGNISGLVETINGYHIIKNIGTTTPGAVALSDIYEKAKETVLTKKVDLEWEKQQESWKNEAVIEYFKDKL